MEEQIVRKENRKTLIVVLVSLTLIIIISIFVGITISKGVKLTNEQYEKIGAYKEDGYYYINYGSYPQTIVNDNELINKLSLLTITNSKGYYEYEGNEYAKLEVTEEIVQMGEWNYYSNLSPLKVGTAWFKVEPIKWRIIKKTNNSFYVMSVYLIDTHIFSKTNSDYENSDIREWLNNDLLNKAFTNIEIEKIAGNSEVYNDKLWLLSVDEVESSIYFKDRESRRTEESDYTLARGCEKWLAASWWLRDTNEDNSEAFVVWSGFVTNREINADYFCVRPAMIVNVE